MGSSNIQDEQRWRVLICRCSFICQSVSVFVLCNATTVTQQYNTLRIPKYGYHSEDNVNPVLCVGVQNIWNTLFTVFHSALIHQPWSMDTNSNCLKFNRQIDAQIRGHNTGCTVNNREVGPKSLWQTWSFISLFWNQVQHKCTCTCFSISGEVVEKISTSFTKTNSVLLDHNKSPNVQNSGHSHTI